MGFRNNPILLLFLTCVLVNCDYTKLPGNLDIPDLKLQSGYLNANENGTWRMFYLLLEPRDIPFSKAPLIIWFNGGPGCSSLGAFFKEFGPIYVTFDGKGLFENEYSWYHKANILFLESPIGVGFSYDQTENNYTKADDDTTAKQNFQVVLDFFINKHPEFSSHDFFIAGQSYGGVYGPMLSALIAQSIQDGEFPNDNFKGLSIGNGFMNVKLIHNTIILWSAYHARTSPDEWDAIKVKCKTPGARDVDEYDFTKFMKTTSRMVYRVDNSTECGRLIAPLMTEYAGKGYDYYDFYQDCYVNFTLPNATGPVKEAMEMLPKKGISALLNNYSTDNKMGYRCWIGKALDTYLNSEIVQKALKIDEKWLGRKEKWAGCNMAMFGEYIMTHQDMTPFFGTLFSNLTTLQHQPWYFSKMNRIAGYFMRYEGSNQFGTKFSIDVVTVKGADVSTHQ